MVKINEVELELDLLDADTADSYEKVLKNVTNLKEKTVGMNASESIRYQCGVIFDVFNTLFGEGTDKKIFGKKVNLGECIDAFEALVNEVNKQMEDISKKYSKYSLNRAKR